MMERDSNGKILPWICPTCGKETTDFPAISRRDNKTNICSACGMSEAMADWSKHLQANKEDK